MGEAVAQAGGGLAAIDIFIVVLYMVGVFALGSFFGKYVKSAGDFFLASRALPFWAIGMSIVVSDIGAMSFVGVSGSAYLHGLAVANFDWIGSMPAMVFAAFIFVPYFWRAGVYTVPEFLGRRYNTAVRVIHASIWGVFLLIILASWLWATGDKLMEPVLGWDPNVVVWVMVIITGVYTFRGGLSAVVMVDVVQMIVMFVGGIALVVLCLWEVGGFAELKSKVSDTQPRAVISLTESGAYTGEQVRDVFANTGLDVERVEPILQESAEKGDRFFVYLNGLTKGELQIEGDAVRNAQGDRRATRALFEAGLADLSTDTNEAELAQYISFEDHYTILLPHDTDKPYPWSGIVFGLGFVLAVAYMSGNQAIVQRTFGARSEWDAKGGMLFGGFLKVFIPLMVTVPGLCAVVLAPNLADADEAFPTMIKLLLPPGLRGLMFVALFAALMSSVDSALNSASTIWTTDLYGRGYRWIAGRELDSHQALVVGRIFTIVFIVLAGLLAPFIESVDSLYVFVQSALSMFQGPTLAILLLGILWRRANRWGGLCGLVLGVAFTTLLNSIDGLFPSNNPFLFVAWWSFVFSSVVTVVVSLLTPPEPDEKVRGLVWGQVLQDGEVQRVLHDRV